MTLTDERIWSARPYLCGPINGCTDEEASNWRDRILKNHFPNAIDPMVRDYRGVEITCYREIVELDKQDVRACDVVLVNYVKPSVGTAMEMFYAWSIGKPVVLWWSPEANETMSPWLRYHSTCIVHTLEDAVAAVRRCIVRDAR